MNDDPVLTFNDEKHQYFINGRKVPGVTQMIKETLGMSFKASDWHLGRGRANHSCYALLAAGKKFECDPMCQGFVDAWKVWAKEHSVKPIAWEIQVFSALYQFAGCLDLFAEVDGKICIVDYKGTLDSRVEWQLGFYALAYPRTKIGLGVELHEDGSPATMKWYKLHRTIQECIAIRSVYGLKQRLGESEKEEVKDE